LRRELPGATAGRNNFNDSRLEQLSQMRAYRDKFTLFMLGPSRHA
jgi:hypothetical protein